MRILKMIHLSIYSITQEEYEEMKAKKENSQFFSLSERNLYILDKDVSYIAIDNTKCEFKEVTFSSYREAIEYLIKLDELVKKV